MAIWNNCLSRFLHRGLALDDFDVVEIFPQNTRHAVIVMHNKILKHQHHVVYSIVATVIILRLEMNLIATSRSVGSKDKSKEL